MFYIYWVNTKALIRMSLAKFWSSTTQIHLAKGKWLCIGHDWENYA